MSDKHAQHWWQRSFAKSLGEGLFFFLICTGMGFCSKLSSESNTPLIQIQTR